MFKKTIERMENELEEALSTVESDDCRKAYLTSRVTEKSSAAEEYNKKALRTTGVAAGPGLFCLLYPMLMLAFVPLEVRALYLAYKSDKSKAQEFVARDYLNKI